MIIMIKLNTSASFRSISKLIGIINITLNLKIKSPSHVSIIIWVKKIGCYTLQKPKERAEDWIIIIDESIQLGQEKLLLVLGIRESNVNFERALKYTDMVPLLEKSKKCWTGELVKEELEKLKKDLGGISYAIGDYGSVIKKGLKLTNIKHIHDVTHKIALIVEKLYKKDERYIEFTQNMSKMRLKLSQSDIAHIIPPKQRKKSRFQNINIISAYGIKILRMLKKQENIEEIREKSNWVKEYKEFIEELSIINKSTLKIQKILKKQSFSIKTVSKCKDILEQLKSEKGKEFSRQMNCYFEEVLELMPNKEKMICTSDIIESNFGKYKNYISDNSMAGITNLVLCIPAFTLKLTKEEIKEALEKTKMIDIENWTKENIGTTLLKRRRDALGDTKVA